MMSGKPSAWIVRSFVALGGILVASGARAADPADEARANTLFQEARAAFIAEDYATACPKYEEVVKLRPGLGARIGLGDCYRKMGRLARAWETYRGIVDDAARIASTSKGFTEKSTAQKRGSEAKSRMGEIEPRLGWITVSVPEAVLALPNLVVTLDGVPLAREVFGTRLPAERGEHVVDASAPGKKSWEKSLAIAEGAELTVAVQALEDEAAPKPEPKSSPQTMGQESPKGTNPATTANPAMMQGPSGPLGPREPDRIPEAPTESFFSTQRIVGLGLGIAGLGAGAVGTYFGLRTMQKRDESEVDGHCAGNTCNEFGYDARKDAYQSGNLSTGLFVAGGVAFAGGLALFLTAPKRTKTQTTSLIVGPSSLYWTGQF
ncbi:tetratricopeptide repeat protein [Polyangium jinanense]|uniref:Tetratricopeptide repeat protein n=1 Tax=Polyangium jinanense TaxID=2829994 RepID=A0A9X3WX87_9BACT|nr:tetratricopeptide repeat protein [Polyangium jinanense]MDC3953092.1 tetratricopeptide repeat protein [Polyangium jinanense]MDC3979787.1 tetratricopeptide repeat protein [Polyangium jinanense]